MRALSKVFGKQAATVEVKVRASYDSKATTLELLVLAVIYLPTYYDRVCVLVLLQDRSLPCVLSVQEATGKAIEKAIKTKVSLCSQ